MSWVFPSTNHLVSTWGGERQGPALCRVWRLLGFSPSVVWRWWASFLDVSENQAVCRYFFLSHNCLFGWREATPFLRKSNYGGWLWWPILADSWSLWGQTQPARWVCSRWRLCACGLPSNNFRGHWSNLEWQLHLACFKVTEWQLLNWNVCWNYLSPVSCVCSSVYSNTGRVIDFRLSPEGYPCTDEHALESREVTTCGGSSPGRTLTNSRSGRDQSSCSFLGMHRWPGCWANSSVGRIGPRHVQRDSFTIDQRPRQDGQKRNSPGRALKDDLKLAPWTGITVGAWHSGKTGSSSCTIRQVVNERQGMSRFWWLVLQSGPHSGEAIKPPIDKGDMIGF